MNRRQTRLPQRWLIADGRPLGRIPRGVGVLVLRDVPVSERRAPLRLEGVVIADEARGDAVRVHNIRQLRRALLRRTPTVLLSPIYPTRSHPDWEPIPRMRVAALARLANRRLIALGGMTEKRFDQVEALGFVGWAGISAWSSKPPTRLRRRASA